MAGFLSCSVDGGRAQALALTATAIASARHRPEDIGCIGPFHCRVWLHYRKIEIGGTGPRNISSGISNTSEVGVTSVLRFTDCSTIERPGIQVPMNESTSFIPLGR